MRHILQRELQYRADGHKHQYAFFLVEKVALCFQQHAVLTCNLEFPIGKFYGEMTGIIRTQEYWDKQFAEHMAFVCTAQILLDLLACGFISMSQINLIVFDEAHHAKKSHPYARIIKDHYLRAGNERPRILGMTASPVDALTRDVRYAAAELESMLCSKIATITDDAMMASQAHRNQVEVKEFYDRLEDPENSKTRLWGIIFQHVRGNPQFKGHLEFAANASSTLGTWCADRYWKLLTTDAEMIKLEARTGRDSFDVDVTASDEAMAAVRRAREEIRDYNLGPIVSGSPELSSKVKLLHEVLEDAFCKRQTKRCIVFVQARSTAFILADLFQQPGMLIPGMTVGYMVNLIQVPLSLRPITNLAVRLVLNRHPPALHTCPTGSRSCLYKSFDTVKQTVCLPPPSRKRESTCQSATSLSGLISTRLPFNIFSPKAERVRNRLFTSA
jgi:endoribonuclease Dicer